MSVAGQRARLKDDAYMTPPWAVRVLFEDPVARGIFGNRPDVLDPFAGDGELLRTVRDHCGVNEVGANEIREEERGRLVDTFGAELVSIGDARLLDFEELGADTTIVTNPPFLLADDALDACSAAPGPVAFLLRANWLYPEKRQGTLRPSLILGLPKRPVFAAFCLGRVEAGRRFKGCGATYPRGFTADVCPSCEALAREVPGRVGPQSDATDYAWHVWSGRASRMPLLRSIPFRIASKARCDELEAEEHA